MTKIQNTKHSFLLRLRKGLEHLILEFWICLGFRILDLKFTS